MSRCSDEFLEHIGRPLFILADERVNLAFSNVWLGV